MLSVDYLNPPSSSKDIKVDRLAQFRQSASRRTEHKIAKSTPFYERLQRIARRQRTHPFTEYLGSKGRQRLLGPRVHSLRHDSWNTIRHGMAFPPETHPLRSQILLKNTQQKQRAS